MRIYPRAVAMTESYRPS